MDRVLGRAQGRHRPAAIQLVAPAELVEDVARLRAALVEAPLLCPAPGALLDRGIEEDLEVGVRQDDRPDVPAGHDDPAGFVGEGSLAVEQGRSQLRDARNRGYALVDERGVDVVGDVLAVDADVGEAAGGVGDELDL